MPKKKLCLAALICWFGAISLAKSVAVPQSSLSWRRCAEVLAGQSSNQKLDTFVQEIVALLGAGSDGPRPLTSTALDLTASDSTTWETGESSSSWISLLQHTILHEKKIELEKRLGSELTQQIFREVQRRLVETSPGLDANLETETRPLNPNQKVMVRSLSVGKVQELEGRSGAIYSLAFSKDKKRLITADAEGSGKVWNLDTGESEFVLKGHHGAMVTAEFSPDETKIMTSSNDGTIRFYRARDGRYLWRFKLDGEKITSAHFSQNGERVVSSSSQGKLRLWDLKNRELKWMINDDTTRIETAVFSPDGLRIVTSNFGGAIRVFDAQAGQIVLSFKASPQGFVGAVGISHDGRWLVTGGNDFVVRIWNSSTGDLVQELNGHSDAIFNAKFSPDDRYIATASKDGFVKIWDWTNGRFLKNHDDHANGQIYDVEFSRDGQLMAVTQGSNVAIFTVEDLITFED